MSGYTSRTWRDTDSENADLAIAGERVGVSATPDSWVRSLNGDPIATRPRHTSLNLEAAKLVAPHVAIGHLMALRRELDARVQRLIRAWPSVWKGGRP